MLTNTVQDRVYKLDKFIVPLAAKAEFMEVVRVINQSLRKQEGFIQDFLLERLTESGELQIVTMVEWADQAAIEKARAAAMILHQEIGFNPQEFLARTGIKADMGNYKPIER